MGEVVQQVVGGFLKQGSAAGIFGMQDTAVGLFELLHCERCTRYTSDADSEVVINTKIREFELISYLSLVSEANVSGAVTLQGILHCGEMCVYDQNGRIVGAHHLKF